MKLRRREFLKQACALLATTPFPRGYPLYSAALGAAPPQRPAAPAYRWIQTPRLVVAEGYTPPFYPILDYDVDKALAVVQQLNGDGLRFPAAAYYAYFPTKTGYPIHPQLGSADPLGRTVDQLRKHALKVVAYLPLNHPFLDVNINYRDIKIDDWLRRSPDGTPMITEHYGYNRLYETCLNSPLHQVILDLVKEVITQYDIDVMYFDGPYQGMGHSDRFCHCKFCQAAYHRDRGKEIPLQEKTLNPEEEREYTLWMRDHICTGLMKEIRQLIRAHGDVPVLYNNSAWLGKRQWRSRAYEAIDGFMFEAAETPEHKLFDIQLGRSTGKTIWTYVGSYQQYNREHLRNTSVQGWFSQPVESQELSLDGFIAAGAGAGLVYWGLNRLFHAPRPLETESGHIIRNIFDFTNKYNDLFASLKPEYQAGIIVGSQTIDWYQGRLFVPDSYQNYFYGAYSVLKDNSYDAEPFVDYELDNRSLSSYPLLYAPNVACLSDSQCAALSRYVEAGGTLLATHLTSTADQFGRPRTDFGLASLLGANLISPDSVELPDLYLKLPSSGELVPQDPQIVCFRTTEGSTTKAETWDYGKQRVLGPAVITCKRGKGEVIYIGSGLEAIYEETRMNAVRQYLGSLFDSVLSQHRTYRLDYQAGVFSHLGRSNNVLMLHIFANIGNKWKQYQSRESFVPVRLLRAELRIPRGRTVASIVLLRSGASISWKTDRDWISFTVPEILVYEAVRVDLERN